MKGTDSAIPQVARPYQGRPAGFISRCLAAGVDLLIVIAALVLVYAGWSVLLLVLRPARFEFPVPSPLVIFAAGFVVLTLYLTVGWTMTGRTYGDHVMGLRVVTLAGGVQRLPQALLRALLCAVFPIGLLWVVVSARNRSLHDIVARTSVTYDWHSVVAMKD